MTPARRQHLSLLQGVRFHEGWDFHTWTFISAGLCLVWIACHTLSPAVEARQDVARVREKGSHGMVFEEPTPLPVARAEAAARLPRFAAIGDVAARKAAFFEFLEPFAQQANEEIRREREEILKLQDVFERDGYLSEASLARLNSILLEYKLPALERADPECFERLLRRADTVPAALALAQAALESGWGTSRFAVEANNLFGMWCYEAGCGLVPRRRPAGRSYEVAAYRSPGESFSAYVRNLNTNQAYAELREIRAALRERGIEPSGADLAAGLVRYSQERWAYVDKVRGVIAHNQLDS